MLSSWHELTSAATGASHFNYKNNNNNDPIMNHKTYKSQNTAWVYLTEKNTV